MKRCVVVSALALAALLAVPALGDAAPGPASVAPTGVEARGLWTPVQGRRCYPGRCTCRGSRVIACTRDCRRDRVCGCVRGRYVCSFYVIG